MSSKKRTGELLVQQGLITEEQLYKAMLTQKALSAQRGIKKQIGEVLVDLELIKEDQVMSVVSTKLGVPYIDIDQYDIDPEILIDIPEKIARDKRVIPVSKIEGALTVAMADPSDLASVDEIEFLCGCEVISVLGSRKGILRAIERSYPLVKNISKVKKPKVAKIKKKQPKPGTEMAPLTENITDTLPDNQQVAPFSGVSSEDLGLGSDEPVKLDDVMDFMGIFDESNISPPTQEEINQAPNVPVQQTPADFYGGTLEDQWGEEIDDNSYKNELTDIWEEVTRNEIKQPQTDIINVGSVVIDDVDKQASVGYEAEDLTTSIIKEAVTKEATMIYIENSTDGIKVRYRIGDTIEDGNPIDDDYGRALIIHFKRLAGLRIAEEYLPQSGRIPTSIGNKRLMISVSSLPTISGEAVVIKILEEKPWLTLDNLGFSLKVVEQLKKALELKRGAILITGPAKSGRTATMYSILKYFDPNDLKIIDIQSNFEFHLPHITQVEIDLQKGFSSSDALSAAIDHHPDIVLLEEVNDYLSSEMALRLGLGGLLVTSITAKNVVESIRKLQDITLDPFLIGTSIVCILNQRVVRKICPKCKKKYTPSRAMVEKIKAMAKIKEVVFFRGVGCQNCNNTGFVGETGIFEMVILNDAIRSAIIAGVPHEELAKQIERNRVRGIWHDAMEKVLKGITTFEEITRVL